MQRLTRRAVRSLGSDAIPHQAQRNHRDASYLSRTFLTSVQHFDQRKVAYRTKNKTRPRSQDRPRDFSRIEPDSHPFERTIDPGAIEQKPTVEPVIRWYHQLSPWSKTRRLADPDNPDADDDTGEVKQLKQEIDRLDEELREMSGEGHEGKTLIEPLLQALPPEEQQKVREHIKREEHLEEQRAKALAQYLPTLEIKWQLPPQQSVYLRQLNSNIRTATMRMGEYTLRRRLWQSYARCKAFLPPFTQFIPEDSWKILFNAQALASMRDDPHWASHLIMLVEDMRDVGQQLRGDQLMLYIEALRFAGRSVNAIEEWQDLREIIGNSQRESAEYELLGVRLFTSHGDLGKAEDIATKFLDTGDKAESRILIPIMDTWIQRKDEIGMKHAWALYLRLKLQLGADITMKDYDSITLSFLRGNRTDLALAVFRDMMLTGQQTNQGSIELYLNSVGLIRQIQHKALDMPEVNKISLTAMTVLPERFHNKYFYGSWIKKLIGMDEADSAASVVELMYERGVMPSPKHLNGIIGAWLRTTSDHHKAKAEQMAWAMIHQRLEFVKSRNKDQTPKGTTPSKTNSFTGPVPHQMNRNIPPATIETFSLLLQYYGRRTKWDSVHIVQNALELGEMTPNHYWINHLLYMDLRQNAHETLWSRYSTMFNEVIRPDWETFACLWHCELAHLDKYKVQAHRGCNFPGPRRIMCEMMSWLETGGAVQCRSAIDDFDKEHYEKIIRCMVQRNDLAGTVVALYLLKHHFNFYPDKITHQFVGKQVAGLLNLRVEPMGAGTYRWRRKRYLKQRKTKIEAVLQLVQDERARILVEAGYDDFEELNDEIRQEERLFVLAEFLRTIMRKTMPPGTNVDACIEEAASEMGAAGLKMEAPHLPYNL